MGNIFFKESPKAEESNEETNLKSSESNLKSSKKEMDLFETMDHIATHYILTMDFVSLQKLQEQEYCDSLVVLTSSIIDSQFTTLDITNLEKRVDQGSKPELITFFKKEVATPNFTKKEKMCKKISKFYVKIAHLFACIVHTINPVYSYTDFWGETVTVPFLKKDTIPKGTTGVTVEKINLCGSRQAILETLDQEQKKDKGEGKEQGKDDNEDDDDSDDEEESHNVCSINMASTLDKEPGIPELMELYYDDQYDIKTGKFKGMSKETTVKFEADLLRFYNTFTGNNAETLPKSIKKFGDIKLRNYCHTKKDKELLDTGVETYTKEYLLTSYAANLNKMMLTINEKHQQLLAIMNQLFLKKDGTDVVRVNPGLTVASLQTLIEETRMVIIELYLHCEVDFVNGIHLYEAIVHYQILESTQNQLKRLVLKKDEMISM